MRKYQMSLGVFITSLILFSGFKKIPGQDNIVTEKSADTNNQVGISKEPVKVNIAGTSAIQGDKGQRPVNVMVYLSQAATEPVTVKYNTEDGSAKAGADYVATKGSIRFEPGEVAKWISVPIIGEVAADPDEDAPVNSQANFMIKINQATGAIIGMATAYIRILQNIARHPSNLGAGVSGNEAVYEVKISFRGYTSFMGDNTDECGIRKDGTVELSGLLHGIENVGPREYDDIVYTGDLEMKIDMDICSAHRLTNGEDRLCGIRVNGSGTVFTELTIYYDSKDEQGTFDSRGGYIKIESKDTSTFTRTVTGECGDQIVEERTMVPNKSIASIFNGNLLSIINTRTLRKGVYEGFDEVRNHTVVEVLRKLR